MPGSDGNQGLGEAKMASSFHGVAFTNASAAHWTKPGYATLARAGFMRNPVVYRCVRLIADSASSIPIVAYQGREELSDHPALGLIQQPNAMQTRAELLDTIVGHLLVAGDAFLKLSKLEDQPRELHALRPDRVRIATDRSGWTEKYEYSNRTGTLSFPCGDDGLSEILHLKFFHPCR